ncbi:MAG TPA: hypothetical protein VL691_01135 [Vicinamibacteria bacterium]|nr:hypothetical protein [Vicinamibacteria bacterium]
MLRSEAEFHIHREPDRDNEKGETIGWIDTQYRPNPGLGLWVPDEMVEGHENVPGGDADVDFDGVIRATARYANYRRFSVDVSEGPARLPEEPEP